MNKKLDEEYMNKLRNDFLNSIKNDNPFNLIKKFYDSEWKVYDMLLSNEDKKVINNYIASLPKDKKEKIMK
jgi:hypothetical protein